MEIQNTFTTILENQSVTVSALLCAETLKIKVKVTDSADEHFGQTFVAEITEQQRNENLNEYFDNLKETFDFMQKEKLIKVDLEKETFTLYEISRMKKQILLFTTELIKDVKTIEEDEKQNSSNYQHLLQISNRCLEKSQIGNDQIKMYLEIIANQLISLRKEKANKNEQNEMKSELLIQKQLLLKIEQQVLLQNNQIQERKKQSQEKFTHFTDKVCELQKQILLQNEKIQILETKINEKSEKITQNTEKINKLENNLSIQIDFCAKTINKKIDELYQSKNEQMEQRFINLENKMNQLNQCVNMQQDKQQKQKQQQNSLMKKCENQRYSNNYCFDGKKLQTRNQNAFAFFQKIDFDVSFTFHVKIIQRNNFNINIGVIDYEDYAENKQNDNNFVYYSSNGIKYPKDISQGNGFNLDDSVTVTVNRNTKIIQWFVNDKLQATEHIEFLGDENRVLYPCVEMFGCWTGIQFTL